MERCPDCGWIQKTYEYKEPVQSQKKETIIPERHIFITVWLILIVVGNVIISFSAFFPRLIYGVDLPAPYMIASIVAGVFGLVMVLGAVLLLSWDKLGFTLITIAFISDIVFCFIYMFVIPPNISRALVPMFIILLVKNCIGYIALRIILNIKKNGVSYWELLNRTFISKP